jgi:HD-like signal output (HDOD) protein
MATTPSFEDLLPVQSDPGKEAIREKLLKVLNSKGEILPSANSPRGKLWHLVNSPESSLTECAEVIQLDTALASRIFRVANSGAYATNADNISDAVLHLGLKFVREQVFNAGVFKEYSGWVLPVAWDLFWLRNIFVARLCDRMTGTYESTNGSEYLAALIHDIGWLFLATYLPDEYLRIFSCGKPVAEAEQGILPFTHAEVSAAIAARSLLPARAVNAILYQHHPLVTAAEGVARELRPNANLLSVVMNVCDKVADICHMDMFVKSDLTMEQLAESPEVLWLNRYGPAPDFYLLAEEELAKSKEIFEVYFSNRKFQ